MMKRSKEVTAPIITIHVSSIDEYIKKIEAAGGKAVMPKQEVPDMGFYSYFIDSEGNVIGLWETLKKD
jgi:predicted enzyme related to lactoylglutathione lyase